MMARRILARSALLLLASACPAIAFHTVFDFRVARIEVDGNVFGPRDGVPDFVENFDADLAPNWVVSVGTVFTAGGDLHLASPGGHFTGVDPLILDISSISSLTALRNGAGDFTVRSRWPLPSMTTNNYIGMTVGDGARGSPNQAVIVLTNLDSTSGAFLGLPPGLAATQGDFLLSDLPGSLTSSTPVDQADLTDDLVLELHFDDASDTFTSAFSVDGGSTFQSPFPPMPMFALEDSAPFGVTVDPVSCEACPGAQAISGKSLSLNEGREASKRTLRALSRDGAIDLGGGYASSDDPVVGNPSSLRIKATAGCNGPCDVMIPLDGSWSYAGKGAGRRGYRYRERNGVVRSCEVREGKLVRVHAKGALLPALSTDPGPIDVVLQTGGRRYCMHFGGTTRFRPGRSLVSRDALPAAACPP